MTPLSPCSPARRRQAMWRSRSLIRRPMRSAQSMPSPIVKKLQRHRKIALAAYGWTEQTCNRAATARLLIETSRLAREAEPASPHWHRDREGAAKNGHHLGPAEYRGSRKQMVG